MCRISFLRHDGTCDGTRIIDWDRKIFFLSATWFNTVIAAISRHLSKCQDGPKLVQITHSSLIAIRFSNMQCLIAPIQDLTQSFQNTARISLVVRLELHTLLIRSVVCASEQLSKRIKLPLFSTVFPSNSCCFCPVGLSLL